MLIKNETIVTVLDNSGEEIFEGVFIEFTQISLGVNGFKNGLILACQEGERITLTAVPLDSVFISTY
jgi:hypothetical protein